MADLLDESAELFGAMAARAMRHRILSAFRLLRDNPGLGRSRDEIGDGNLRFWPVRPYWVIYDYDRGDGIVEVLAIVPMRSDLMRQLLGDPLN